MAVKGKVKRIAIVGLGLIGSSLAMALKVNGYQIVGIARKKETIDLALARRAIDSGFTQIISEAFNGVELIFLTGPLSLISEHIEKVSKLVSNEVILSDVGSTKSEICKTAKNVLPENIVFVGGHPMAGTEKAGFVAAQVGLFKNCAWLFTPLDESKKSKEALKILEELAMQIGAVPIVTDSEKHDQAVALVSHLPLLASIGLCQIVKNLSDPELLRLASLIASSGYRDTTRIGGGNPNMNFDLINSNYLQLVELLPKYCKELETITKLAKEKPDDLLKMMEEINKWRNNLYNSDGKNNLLSRSILKLTN